MRCWWLAAGAAALLILACDNAPVEAPTNYGDGGSGVGGEGVGAIAGDCQALCAHTKNLSCDEVDCTSGCMSQHDTDPKCRTEFAADIACLADHLDEVFYPCIERPADCQIIHDTWLGCTGTEGCGQVECPTVNEELCRCRSVCNSVLYEEMCITNEDGTIDCICTEEGAVVAECPDMPLSCGGFFVGCCAALVT